MEQYKYNCIHGGGEYHGYVFAEGGETIFQVHYPMYHYDEDLGEKLEELTLFDLGIMKNTLDVVGLQNHLRNLKLIGPDAVVVMDSEKADKGAVIESITGGVHSAVNPVVGYEGGGAIMTFTKKYRQNESNNMHSENVVLLAERYGSKDDVRDAKTILAKHNAIGRLTPELQEERTALEKKLYPKFQAELKDSKAYGGPTEWNIDLFNEGGEVKWQDVDAGDSALVKSENKMGVIMKAYGRKFHLKFVDGTEKTYDANELKFFKDEEMAEGGETSKMANGGQIEHEYEVTGGGFGKPYKVKAKSKEDAIEQARSVLRPVFGTVKKREFKARKLEYGGALESMKGGGKTKSFKEMTFKEKSASIQAKLKGSKVSPKYQKLYGKTYDSKEAKQAADAITGKIVSKMKE